MTRNMLFEWLVTSWANMPVATAPAVLVLDSFATHTSDAVLQRVQAQGTIPKIIPPGFSGALHPLKHGIIDLFRNQVMWMWRQWMTAAVAAGYSANPPLDSVLRWIAASWDAVNPADISAGFLAAGIVREDWE
eukprot:GHVU01051522.1.p1 GENE.GHVU01051522.1~~GHVU01051522.1.p1  ORF type:complete len:133 (+),score=10.00 GHVU01051522.1:208-606(+)